MPSITWNGKEIANPVLRGVAAVAAGTGAVVGAGAVVVLLGLCVALWPIWVPLDWVLKRFDRKGFIRPHPDGTFSLIFGWDSFRKI